MKKLRILDFLTHPGHQYELCKLPHDFFFIRRSNEEWSTMCRPKPQNVQFINPKEINDKDYDLIIVHNSIHYEIAKHLNLPKIALIHTTYVGGGDVKCKQHWDKVWTDIPIVFNSYQAQKDWGLINCKKQYVIWQGFDPAEWGPWNGGLNRILVVCNEFLKRRSVCGLDLFLEVIKGLDCTVVGANPELDTKFSTDFENLKWYYNSYSVYFNTTIKSPMPRSRGEAMMSGMPIVSTDNYDTKEFIKNGVNGFISNDPRELHQYLSVLLRNEKLRKHFSEQSRKVAIERFHISRFLNQWKELLGMVI